jgi:cytochrome c6
VRGASVWLLPLLLAACTGAEERERQARIEAGREVFTELSRPRCTLCHTLRDAGATGKVGPDLDRLKPDTLRVARAVTSGVGVMPSQAGNLTGEQIRAVAAYVAAVAGRED